MDTWRHQANALAGSRLYGVNEQSREQKLDYDCAVQVGRHRQRTKLYQTRVEYKLNTSWKAEGEGRKKFTAMWL